MILTHLALFSFFKGAGTASSPTPTPTPVVAETPRPPRPGDGRRILRAFKPTGLGPRRKDKAPQVSFDTAGQSFGATTTTATMSPAAVEREIGSILRKKVRTDEDEVILLLLMAASAAIN